MIKDFIRLKKFIRVILDEWLFNNKLITLDLFLATLNLIINLMIELEQLRLMQLNYCHYN